MRKMNRPLENVNGHVVGFDVHSESITFCRMDRKGREVATGAFPADARSLERFLKKHVGQKRCHFAFEASGYSLWLYDFLVDRYDEDRVHVAHAKHVRMIANSKRKNDENDAYWLARLTHEGRLPEAQLPDGELRELRLATRFRTRMVRERTKVIARIRSLLAQVAVRIRPALTSLEGRACLSEALAGLSGARREIVSEHTGDLDRLCERIAKWEKRIEELVKDLPDVQALQREIPGVGAVLGAAIYAETGSLRRFVSAKQLGGYTGFAPSDRSSAGKTRHGAMDRQGSPFLRWALVQAVIACTRSRHGAGKAVGDWVRKRYARMGIKKRAQCAAARKLAETMWRLFHYGECFDAARAFPS
jgi:transposase